LLGWTVHIPSRHVHPKVRAAGENMRAAQAEYDERAQELAAPAGKRAQLTQRLLQEPDRAKAARELTDFSSKPVDPFFIG